LPTNWGVTAAGLTQTVVGTGTSKGISYIDIRLNGTTSAAFGSIYFEPSNSAAASNSQAWTQSAYLSVVSGSTSNISYLALNIDQYSSVPTYLSSLQGASFLWSINSTLTRNTGGYTTNNASTAFVRPYLALSWNSGAAIDITLRIGYPQLELGSFATSVIPTTSATVTRAADNASMVGSNFSSWYNASQGTFVLNAITNVVGSPNFPRFFFVRGATTADSISAIQFRNAGSFGSNVTTSGVSQGDVSIGGLVVGSAFKGSIGYAANNVGVSFNGSAVSTDATVTLPTVNALDFSNVGGTSQSFSGYLIKFNYYPQRLTNAELQAFSK
jgi:hypothetical protein